VSWCPVRPALPGVVFLLALRGFQLETRGLTIYDSDDRKKRKELNCFSVDTVAVRCGCWCPRRAVGVHLPCPQALVGPVDSEGWQFSLQIPSPKDMSVLITLEFAADSEDARTVWGTTICG
jgi:hypothetical protein